MSKVKSIFKRSLAILLAMLTIMSVGLTSAIALNLDMAQTAGYVDLAETGANQVYTAGEYIYIKNFKLGDGVTWFSSGSPYGYAHIWNSSASHDYAFELYSGTKNADGAIYRAKISDGGTYTNVIFTRNTASGGPWSNSWGQTGDLVLSSSKYNCYTSFSTGSTSYTGSHYAVAPASATLSASGYTSGSGTSSDPYLVPAGGSYSVTLKATKADPGMEGYGLSIDTNASKETSNTTGTYTETKTASTTANTTFSHTGYAWNYEYSTSYYSSSKTSNTIYFKTVATDHNVTFMSQGSQFGSVQIVNDGGNATTPATEPTRTGYDFLGWSLTDGGEVVTVENQTITEDTTFYAVWAVKNYPITFKYGLNGEKSTTIEAAYGSTPTAPSAEEVAVEGYTFDGWTPAISAVPVDGATYTAKYTINTYTLTISGFDSTKAELDIDGTSYLDDDVISKTYGETASVTITPVEGQVLTVNGEEVTYGESYEATITFDKDQTLTLGFNIKTFTVTIKQPQGISQNVFIGTTQYSGGTSTSKEIEYGSNTLKITAPTNYYIESVVGITTNYDDTDGSKMKNYLEFELNVTADREITIKYKECPKFDLTVEQEGFDTSKPSTYFALNVADKDYTSEGPAATVTENLYGGEYEITVTAPLNHYIPELWVDGVQVITGEESYTTAYYAISYTVNLTAATTVKIVYKSNPVVDITAEKDGETLFIESGSYSYGKSYTIEIPAEEGYYISKVTGTINGVSVNYTSEDYSNSTFTEVIDFLEKDTELVAYYTAIPTVDVTVAVNDANGGTATGTGIVDGVVTVYSGSKAYLSATANTGYRFTGWTADPADAINTAQVDLSQLAIDFVPQRNVTVTANFEPITGTVKVTAGEGGTVTSEGENKVTYPTIVTSTATGDASNGYEFTHWTVESQGVEGKDYTATITDNVIEVQILTQDTVVNVTANFANAQKIKVYTYSDSGFNKLNMIEYSATDSKVVYDGGQSTIVFGDQNWYTPTTGEVTLTAGYTEQITAQLSSSVVDTTTGVVLYIKISDEWLEHDWNYEGPTLAITGNDNKTASAYINASNTSGIDDPYEPTSDSWVGQGTNIGNNVYKWVITDATQISLLKSNGFTLYSKKISEAKVWEACITHGTYSTDANYYTVSSANATYSSDTYKACCFNTTSNGDYPTQTNVIDITDILYNGNQWLGKDEVWLYFTSDNKVIATDRRALADYITSADIKNTYNNGKNDAGWEDDLWGDFTDAYDAAMSTLGAGNSTETQLSDALTDLDTARKALKLTSTVSIVGIHGAEPQSTSDVNYGTIDFPDIDYTTHTNSGNIGDNNGYHYQIDYLTATVERNSTITVTTTLTSTYATDYLVYGWVVNGTDWVSATQDIDNTSKYVGSYTCKNNATFTPVYFRKDVIANWETDDNYLKVYANIEGASEKWGNYISAYTWTNSKTYYQFGHWTGQLMIPDTGNPGMYYTFVEMVSPNGTDAIAGITFTNYGNNDPINNEARYQTYDYYEFKELDRLGYNNIVFQLKTFEGNENWNLNQTSVNLSDYQFDYFRDFSGNMIDITREKLVEVSDPELYIVRTGPCGAENGIGYQSSLIKGSDYYVDTYVYDKNGNFLVACKSFELLDLATLATNSGENLASYAGSPVMVDYASLTNVSGNERFDGEWFGTIYGLTNVTIKTEVAFQKENGEIQYFQGQNDVDGVGQAYINGEHIQEVAHGSEGHTINAIVADGNDFVGWYKATVADDGSYTIDATADPLIVERSTTIQASADAVYVAVFKEHPEGTFTVNNYYYTYKDFEGYPISPYVPPVFGGDTSYSIRDVKIHKIYDAYTKQDVSIGNEFAGTYTQSMENISVGDKLEITIKTTPTYPRDYVYAWYILAPDSYGVNFEEIGTNVIQNNYVPGESKEFTFTYTVEAGVNNITIYSDVVHITPEVTFTYIYNNRYNETKSYVVKHTLTDEELKDFDDLNESAEFKETIRRLAPYVGDIYKNVTWEIDNISSDATNWTLRATEADIYTVNVNVNGEVLDPPITGRFNETVSIYAKDIDKTVTGNKGIWYLDTNKDDAFTEGVDEILGLGSYYGLVITGNANVCFTNDIEVMNQIILADAVYGYERATDGSGNVTINKVYVDYLISMLLNVYTGGYIDCNNNKQQDIDTEPTIIDEENTNTPVSLKAIEKAGYKVDYGMVHELLNTFGDNKVEIKDTFYGKDSTAMSDTNLTNMLISGSATEKGATYTTEAGSEMLATLLYKYSAIAYEDYATNKNRVIMTFGYDNTDYYRNLYYNVKAYLTISAKGTETMTKENTMFVFSNSATLNIAEDDKITNGEATNS